MSNHGGLRSGAGRKKVIDRKDSRVIRIPVEYSFIIKSILNVLKDDPEREKYIINSIFMDKKILSKIGT